MGKSNKNLLKVIILSGWGLEQLMEILNESIRKLKGIGDKRADAFGRLGICSIADLLDCFPRDYEDRTIKRPVSALVPGESACITASVCSRPSVSRSKSGKTIISVRVCDQSSCLDIKFFNKNYITKALSVGKSYIFFGKLENDRHTMLNPDFEEISAQSSKMNRILPVYRLTAGLTRAAFFNAVMTALPYTEQMEEALPSYIIKKYHFCSLPDAYRMLHFPKSLKETNEAKRRIAYQEMLMLCLRLSRMKRARRLMPGIRLRPVDLTPFLDALPYKMTNAQLRVIDEIIGDINSGFPINRLIQGDVGSGKTMVAAASVFITAKNGYQSVLMAPTEILARQHFNNLRPLFETLNIRCSLITGGMKKSEKDAAFSDISSGKSLLIIGTHALLNNLIQFKSLALVITDEQHRFGVEQRAAIASKAITPNIIVMSATPIPRTLALIIFGELDISVIDELPPGRLPVDTFLINDEIRLRMYSFIRKNISLGHQVYIVCAAIDENDENDIRAAAVYADDLAKNVFPDLKIALLHGRMKPAEKQAVMDAFSNGDIELLISTTVIEVGIDVPNASLMIIENAERFGLSTLHQLRGRVGRGSDKSCCVLLSNSKSPVVLERLKMFCKTSDGFRVAEADLKNRGPGDFFGKRQHGLPILKSASLLSDTKLLKCAWDDASAILDDDPALSAPDNSILKKYSDIFFKYDMDNSSKMN